MNNLVNFIDKFNKKKIIIIGDIMLDKYIWGSVDRISPEAPVPVVRAIKESYIPGGAANVANNIAALGAKAFIIGLAGDDEAHSILISELKKRDIDTRGIIQDKDKPTIQKIRIIGQKQQLLRIDYEKVDYLNKEFENKTMNLVSSLIDETDAIIVSDYAKGVITRSLMKNIVDLCKRYGKIIVIDPKPQHIGYYKGVTVMTPNMKEAQEMSDVDFEASYESGSIDNIGMHLLEKIGAPVLITRGEQGMSLYEKNGKITHIQTKAKEVYDVTGAGDTVVATLTLALSSGAGLAESAGIANHAAGIVVGKVGTSVATVEELKKSIENE